MVPGPLQLIGVFRRERLRHHARCAILTLDAEERHDERYGAYAHAPAGVPASLTKLPGQTILLTRLDGLRHPLLCQIIFWGVHLLTSLCSLAVLDVLCHFVIDTLVQGRVRAHRPKE